MHNFIPLNGSPELQEEAIEQIANLPSLPIHQLRFEWEKDVFLMAENDPSDSSLIRIGVVIKRQE